MTPVGWNAIEPGSPEGVASAARLREGEERAKSDVLRALHPASEGTAHTEPTSQEYLQDMPAAADGRGRSRALQPSTRPVRLTTFTARELQAMTLAEPRWAVPGLITDGINLFAGAPKVGKSWLSLSLALSVAAGGIALGEIPVEAGPCLYLALEDTGRRLQSRVNKLLHGQPAPDDLLFSTECDPIDLGSAERIDRWLTKTSGARLVVIDVLQRLRGHVPGRTNDYQADYAAINELKQVSDAHGVGFLLVHHTRKQGAENFTDEISGTNGLAGAADTSLVLKRARNNADGQLFVTGRDVEECVRALRFDKTDGSWALLPGDALDWTVSEQRRAVLGALRVTPGLGTTKLAALLGVNLNTMKSTVKRMADDGQIASDGSGGYFVDEEHG